LLFNIKTIKMNTAVKSWKTTVAGFALAIWVGIQPILNKGDFEIHRDWKSLVYAALFAVMGLLVKDHDVSGAPPVRVDEEGLPEDSPSVPAPVIQQGASLSVDHSKNLGVTTFTPDDKQ
jgi:hypothetical protein